MSDDVFRDLWVNAAPEFRTLSRRSWLIVTALVHTQCSIHEAVEAVSSVAIEHPEWDMEERRTAEEWIASDE